VVSTSVSIGSESCQQQGVMLIVPLQKRHRGHCTRVTVTNQPSSVRLHHPGCLHGVCLTFFLYLGWTERHKKDKRSAET